jgi:urease accessory protein UreF
MQPVMAGCVQKSMGLAVSDISNFNPGLDVASILHETLEVRLYMS